MKPLYIFDLDGTLALIGHRRHLAVAGEWDEFYKACVKDQINIPVLQILLSLSAGIQIEPDIKIWSGRSDLVLKETVDWLCKCTAFSKTKIMNILRMRNHGDYMPDQLLKARWYDELCPADKARLICVFDDRQKVVDMWRSIGVTCLQVAKGDF